MKTFDQSKSVSFVSRTQADRSSSTRARIVAAAVAVLCDKGYSAATIKVISDEAGVSVGALQHHFSSKAKLMAAVAEALAATRHAQYGSPLKPGFGAALYPMLIAEIWENVKRPEFLATMEIALAQRSDDELRQETEMHLTALEAILEADTVSLLANYGRDLEYGKLARRMTAAFMSGLALRNMAGLENEAEAMVVHWGKILAALELKPELASMSPVT
ncbi:TetR/AcrR family transcriptional regulator [Blastomonas sp. SL216]|uniref:TetR/AcrR family transcriptional regulator n=1 Tax=Blastomonas sp. SL216 TaxID=2995169 RepID=UPI0023779ACD|nr:TetR/AcrR family transcriptional regulator [Blastomonas sp. SL216]